MAQRPIVHLTTDTFSPDAFGVTELEHRHCAFQHEFNSKRNSASKHSVRTSPLLESFKFHSGTPWMMLRRTARIRGRIFSSI